MASKSDAPPRRAEPVADQHPEDDGHDSSEQPPESQSADAADVSKLLRMSPFKCPRTPSPARQKHSPPPVKRTRRSYSDVSDLRAANAPPLPFDDDSDRDERLAQFRARLARGEFFVPRRGAAQPSQSA